MLVCDVGPRDGLQTKPDMLAAGRRCQLPGQVYRAGVWRTDVSGSPSASSA